MLGGAGGINISGTLGLSQNKDSSGNMGAVSIGIGGFGGTGGNAGDATLTYAGEVTAVPTPDGSPGTVADT